MVSTPPRRGGGVTQLRGPASYSVGCETDDRRRGNTAAPDVSEVCRGEPNHRGLSSPPRDVRGQPKRQPRFRARRCRLARQAVGAARVRLPLGGIDDKRPDPGMVDLRVDSGKAGPRAPGTEAHDPDLHAGALDLNSGPPLSPWQESMPSAPAETMSFGKYDRGP